MNQSYDLTVIPFPRRSFLFNLLPLLLEMAIIEAELGNRGSLSEFMRKKS